MIRRTAQLVALLILAAPCVHSLQPADPQEALAEARILAADRRFQDVYDLLQPYLADNPDSELAWEIAAEMGRAAFHTARYQQALTILRTVVALRPVILEPALYLGATSYLLGDRAQSLAVLEAVLQSGTTDLYRAVTLPGEAAFLADPEVRELLERYSRPLVIDIDRGACLGLVIGQPRANVVERLGAATVDGGAIAARAGPRLIWVWTFGENDALEEVVVHPGNMWRYTPYRVRIADALPWDATPSDALAALGQPQRNTPSDDTTLTLGWDRGEFALDLVFTQENAGEPGPARLEIVRLYKRPRDVSSES